MTWLHWSLELPSVKWWQSCLPRSHEWNDVSRTEHMWEMSERTFFLLSCGGFSTCLSIDIILDMVVKRYSQWLPLPCLKFSHFEFLLNLQFLKANIPKIIFFPGHLRLPHLKVPKWASPWGHGTEGLWIVTQVWMLMSANSGLQAPHKEGKPWRGWSGREKKGSCFESAKIYTYTSWKLYPKSLPLTA